MPFSLVAPGWPGEIGRKGSSFSSEALAIFAAMVTPPTSTRKPLIDAFVRSLKDVGAWPLFDFLDVHAAETPQAGRINWVKPGTYDASPINSPSFTADRGYTGDGSTSTLISNFNPATASSPKFSQNGAHMGMWALTNIPNGSNPSYDFGAVQSYIGRHVTVSGRAVGRPNTAADVTYADSAYPGHLCWVRSASGAWAFYVNGVQVATGTTASVAPANATLRILGVSSLFGANQLALAHAGGALSAAQVAGVYGASRTYLQAIGAIP